MYAANFYLSTLLLFCTTDEHLAQMFINFIYVLVSLGCY